MKLAILISGQTSRCMYEYQRINMIYNIKNYDIYIVLSETTSTPFTSSIEDNNLTVNKDTLYKYYSKYSNNCYIKIIPEVEFLQNIYKINRQLRNNYKGSIILNDTRWYSNLKMFYLRFLTLEFAKSSRKPYSHYLYFREDNQFTFPINLYLYSIYGTNSLLTDSYNRFNGFCDKIFFGKVEYFDILFGNNLYQYIDTWINFGIQNKGDLETETFYKHLLTTNNINIKCINFFRNDIRFIKGQVVTPELYKKTPMKILKVEYKNILWVIIVLIFIYYFTH